MGAIVLLIILCPIMVLIAIILLFYNKGSVVFKQVRPGKDENPFLLYKFQTMKPSIGNFVSDKERITRLGNLIRKTSLDELPQLINILKGEMSFVGPRPLLMEYLPLYSAEQRKRHSVLPGITGLAQVKGRNSLSWKQKFELDLHYIEKMSFLMDLKILALTPLSVFSSKGVYGYKGQIVEKFKGE